MQDRWCRRLAILAALWLVVSLVLQVVVALTLH
jgi:hypothetical protein